MKKYGDKRHTHGKVKGHGHDCKLCAPTVKNAKAKARTEGKRAISIGNAIDLESFVFANGVYRVHNRAMCKGPCAIHNPSKHKMVKWPMLLRETLLIERICPCGVGHPDPDSVRYLHSIGRQSMDVHGCCGACSGKGCVK